MSFCRCRPGSLRSSRGVGLSIARGRSVVVIRDFSCTSPIGADEDQRRYARRNSGGCGTSVGCSVLLFSCPLPNKPTDQTICFFLPLDGLCRLLDIFRHTERPMKIEIVVDPTKAAPAASLASRVAPAPAAPVAAVARFADMTSKSSPVY